MKKAEVKKGKKKNALKEYWPLYRDRFKFCVNVKN